MWNNIILASPTRLLCLTRGCSSSYLNYLKSLMSYCFSEVLPPCSQNLLIACTRKSREASVANSLRVTTTDQQTNNSIARSDFECIRGDEANGKKVYRYR